MKLYIVTVESCEPYENNSHETCGVYDSLEKAQARVEEIEKIYNKEYYAEFQKTISEYEKMYGKEQALKRAEQDVRLSIKEYAVLIEETELNETISTVEESTIGKYHHEYE